MQSPNKHWNDLIASSEAQQEYGYLLIANIENPQYNTIYKITDENRENERKFKTTRYRIFLFVQQKFLFMVLLIIEEQS